jgi:hypothetical protein
MSYWRFFPTEDGWGRVPMWGFAQVTASAHDDLEDGVRVYGYLPPSTHLTIRPDRVGAAGFVDASPHRADLPRPYNAYARVDADLAYQECYEDHQMLLRPLFATSFLIDDFLGLNDLFGAEVVVFSSASSKTASGTAFLASQRDGLEVVGLTSAGNLEFVESLDVYDQVLAYDAVDSLARRPAVYVDMAGDTRVREAVHGRYGDLLGHSAVVGATHHEERGSVPDSLPGPRPEFFFAPDQVKRRAPEWGGRAGVERRLAEAWAPYIEWADGWLVVEHGRGPDAVKRAYLDVLEGRTHPSVGHVLSLGE